jgi:hypothetical protein
VLPIGSLFPCRAKIPARVLFSVVASTLLLGTAFLVFPALGQPRTSTRAQVEVGSQSLASFTYVRTAGEEETHVTGLYYQSPERVVICVQEPIRQWIQITEQDVTIYYAQEGRALRLGPASPLSNPFYMLFLGSAGRDLDLAKLGFQLSGKTMARDSLITRWSPPEGLASRIGEAQLIIVRDQLGAFELSARDGSLLASVRFSDFRKVGTREFPFGLEMITPPPDASREEIRLAWIEADASPPDSIAHFRIPPEIQIEDVGR